MPTSILADATHIFFSVQDIRIFIMSGANDHVTGVDDSSKPLNEATYEAGERQLELLRIRFVNPWTWFILDG